MADTWATVPASDVREGDRIRLRSGMEMVVSRIEPAFMGVADLVAFIEDTPARWFKQPMASNAEVEVTRMT